MTDSSNHLPSWQSVFLIWECAGVLVPEISDDDSLHLLHDLERVARTFIPAKEIAEADRARPNAYLPDLADQCSKLATALSEVDEISYARIAGASPTPANHLLTHTISDLHLLEAAFRNTLEPAVPRKKTHEHNEFLVSLLAEVFEQETGRKASITTAPVTNERKGPFVDFVHTFITEFLPGHAPVPNGKAIERALKSRRDNPDPLLKPTET
ncbi:MAG: hypothetical protein HOA60_13800 [Rhodospirillales bacterium]|jgi:hypothetical protein|nr:hypothetical protein [Rhodospirillales bacterium]